MNTITKALLVAAGGALPVWAIVTRRDLEWIDWGRGRVACMHCALDDRRRER